MQYLNGWALLLPGANMEVCVQLYALYGPVWPWMALDGAVWNTLGGWSNALVLGLA